MNCPKCNLKLFSTDRGVCPKCDPPPIPEIFDRAPEAKKVTRDYAQKFGHPSEMTLDFITRSHVIGVIAHCKGNKTQAAKILGVTPHTVFNKLSSWGLCDRESQS